MNSEISRVLDPIQKNLHDPKEREYFAIHAVRYAVILDTILSLGLHTGAKILDIGCFPPHLFHSLEQLGFVVSGISSHHEPMKGADIRELNIEEDEFPWKDGYFDVVLMSEVVEHMVVDPAIYLKKIHRVLKVQGDCIITTPNAVHLKHRLQLLFGKTVTFPVSQLRIQARTDDAIYFRHNREFTMSELVDVIRSSGFHVDEQQYVSVYTPFRKERTSASFITFLVKMVGWMITQCIPSCRDTLVVVAHTQKEQV